MDLAYSALTVHGLEFPSFIPYPGFDFIQDTVLHAHRSQQVLKSEKNCMGIVALFNAYITLEMKVLCLIYSNKWRQHKTRVQDQHFDVFSQQNFQLLLIFSFSTSQPLFFIALKVSCFVVPAMFVFLMHDVPGASSAKQSKARVRHIHATVIRFVQIRIKVYMHKHKNRLLKAM